MFVKLPDELVFKIRMPLSGNRNGMDDFKFFFGGKFFLAVFPNIITTL